MISVLRSPRADLTPRSEGGRRDEPTPGVRTKTRATTVVAALVVSLAACVAAPALAQAPALGTSAASAARAVAEPGADPFYLSLFDDGLRSLAAGESARAARELRLACFGFLEQPVRLGSCLAYLGVAQARQQDRSAFTDTFQRLAAVETSFQGYSKAELPPRIRAELSRALGLWIAEERLASVPSFAPIAEWQEASRLARLPPREIRKQLTERREAEPDNTRWILMMADLELAEKKAGRARELVEEALRLEPDNPRALCTRGLIRARDGECAGAVADLVPCARARQDVGHAAALLECQLALGERDAARQFVGELPPDLAAHRELGPLVRETERGQVEQAESQPIDPGPAPGSLTASEEQEESAERRPASPLDDGGETTSTAPAPSREAAAELDLDEPLEPSAPERLTAADGLSEQERSQLEEARIQAREAREIPALLETLRLAREVADAHPDYREAQYLVTEIAYRARRFDTAVEYFRRGGEPDSAEPFLLFFYAVSLYETGEQAEAADMLRKSLPGITSNSFVESYKTKILGTENASR